MTPKTKMNQFSWNKPKIIMDLMQNLTMLFVDITQIHFIHHTFNSLFLLVTTCQVFDWILGEIKIVIKRGRTKVTEAIALDLSETVPDIWVK